MNEVEAVARAICAADGHDFDEVCGVDANPDEGYCDSGTCVASCWEEHDAEQARRWYRHIAQAAIAALDAARGDQVARVVEWLREALAGSIAAISDPRGLDDAICCSGHMCGCRGSSHRELLLHDLSEVLARAALKDTRHD